MLHYCMLFCFRCGTIVSADSSGAVQFWDSQFGTLLHAHSHHKGDVNALVASPSHNKVFSAGSDGQVWLSAFDLVYLSISFGWFQLCLEHLLFTRLMLSL